MTIKEAHEKAVQDDRMLIVQGEVSGKWYQDYILDFVAECGEEECILLMDGNVTVTVARKEGVLKAWIRVESRAFDKTRSFAIRKPKTLEPYFMVDGARHDLKPNEFKALREAMREVGYGI